MVVVEAMASGCVPLISEACTEVAEHGRTGFRHAVGDVDALTDQITVLHEDRERLNALRAACIDAAANHTWWKAGVRLVDAYDEVLSELSAVTRVAA